MPKLKHNKLLYIHVLWKQSNHPVLRMAYGSQTHLLKKLLLLSQMVAVKTWRFLFTFVYIWNNTPKF